MSLDSQLTRRLRRHADALADHDRAAVYTLIGLEVASLPAPAVVEILDVVRRHDRQAVALLRRQMRAYGLLADDGSRS